MDEIQESSEPGSPLCSPCLEPDTPDSLNNACLMNDTDPLFEDNGHFHEFSSTFVPETPRYLSFVNIDMNYWCFCYVADSS